MNRVEKILTGIIKNDRVAGAYLFVGPPGVGKKETAEGFADSLGCKKQDKFFLAPEGKLIKIEQIRELQKWVRYGPSVSPYLVLIVEDADSLTDQAAAAFLKTLEEPAPGVVFILLAARGDKILPTILSRCQKIIFAEKKLDWQLPEELNVVCAELTKVKDLGMFGLLRLSAQLSKEKEKIEERLYDLAHFCRYKLVNARQAKIILTALHQIKRRANLKLVLDNMCLKLGEARVE
ncbi:hypothetical protein A2291_02300 [candidate division WOR-1 bacterium RIFOXYB2_FULL_42_35]|uniref:AAA+ ATPase domain-containing protein n=1 Tax=candidate division WOR-1 bacterium RIFOXYC2_FULL_41_25 TaxID=1802586 RepID=A0A1F4TR41_UNCSA|nr:MAG: hypothetical protein A2247_07225 [candidate division WOR-1 bacterium RIFOXYA2_FULL_41_14]OGC25394.1 MAG: hypothetical protein A2291_02300 [candidate division WOR-1 bacterium RIFOXYB2_FULL_42_35]OGC35194.1 MAG: hypothetical protein A2462_07535 [candidate division WOR-1 bacterium RIFOXYC2_FULL_41_25]OGC42982.1 MAG: hypothetical protein A2548_04790 [candidate division WOR-1 bacterium RIFOXYD2_FULL_41_8]